MKAFCKFNMIREEENIVELVSLGVVTEDNTEFYAEFKNFKFNAERYKCLNTAISSEDGIEAIRNSLEMTHIDTFDPHVAYHSFNYPNSDNASAYTFNIWGKKHQVEFELGSWLSRIRKEHGRGIEIYMNTEDIEIFNLLMWTWNARFSRLNIKPYSINPYMGYMLSVDRKIDECGWNALHEARFMRSSYNLWTEFHKDDIRGSASNIMRI